MGRLDPYSRLISDLSKGNNINIWLIVPEANVPYRVGITLYHPNGANAARARRIARKVARKYRGLEALVLGPSYADDSRKEALMFFGFRSKRSEDKAA